MSDPDPSLLHGHSEHCCCRQIPGPDPGACPNCGGWRKAGLTHDCEAQRQRVEDDVNRMVEAWKALNDV